MQQTITIENRVNLALRSRPVRHGVPWPLGAVGSGAAISALDEHGRPVPVAARPLNHWEDGSVQWSLVDLVLDVPASGTRTIEVGTEPCGAAPVEHPVTVREGDGQVTVGNGLTDLRFGPDGIVELWTCEGRPVIEAGGFDVRVVGSDGVVYSAGACSDLRFRVEESSPLCAVARVDGRHESREGETLLDFWLRFRVTADRRDVKITYHYHNLEAAEPGIHVRSIETELRAALPVDAPRAIMQVNRGRDFRPEYLRLGADLEICASNTMDLDRYEETHQQQGIMGGGDGRVFVRDMAVLGEDPEAKPWFLREVKDFKFRTGDRPEAYTFGYLGLVDEAASLVVAGANMVGLHPKSLRVAGNVVRYAVWPEWAGLMDITQGEGRSVDLHVGPLPPGVSDAAVAAQYLDWELSGLYSHFPTRPTVAVSLDSAHVRRCAVFGVEKLPAYDPDRRFAFERKVLSQWTPEGGAPANGHWHYGDVFYAWDIGGNNEEMAGLVWFQEYLRTGRASCLERGLAQARHIAEVDVVARSADPYQDGGMCSHGPRHNHCAAYPSHTWFTELLCAYALTGDSELLETARRVCDNLVFWISDPKGFQIICSDGREAGQPLINLAWCYRFLPDQRYVDAMWKVVRECFMANVARHGRLVYMKPREDMPLLQYEGYGEWAAWEGLFWFWELTRDEELKQFLLSQFEWRLTEERMGTHGSFRATDYNAAAYAWYMTEDPKWLQRVERPFRAVFRSAQWPFAWVKSMYFIELAFAHGLVTDDEVLIS